MASSVRNFSRQSSPAIGEKKSDGSSVLVVDEGDSVVDDGESRNSQFSEPLDARWSTPIRFVKRDSSRYGVATSWSEHRHSQQLQDYAKPDAPEMKAVFVDAMAMKEKVRNRLCKPTIDLYKDKGCAQCIVRSTVFEQMTLAVIGINAIWIAVDTDYNSSAMLLDAHPVFQVAEHCFCVFFSFEWTARFIAFHHKRDAFYDKWFVFDSCLVLLMVMETWVLTLVSIASGGAGASGLGNASVLRVARLLRLTRMARMARLLRAMPELMILVKGMVAAMRSVFFTLLLLVIVMYVFGIGFTQLTEDTDIGRVHFSSVPDSMYTLLIYGTLLDNVGVMANLLGSESYIFTGIFFIFVLLAALTVMNMLIGVLCEVVSAVAATEREEMLVSYVNRKVKQILESLDSDGGGTISKEEFAQILDNNEAIRALQDVGVDVVGLVDFADVIFEDEDELTFSRFMEVVLQLRGTNNATVKDIVDFRKFVRQELQLMSRQIVARNSDVAEMIDLLRGMTYQAQASKYHARASRRYSTMSRAASNATVKEAMSRAASTATVKDMPTVKRRDSTNSTVVQEASCNSIEAKEFAEKLQEQIVGLLEEEVKEKEMSLPRTIHASDRAVLLRQNSNDSLQSVDVEGIIPKESEIQRRYKLACELEYKGNGHQSLCEDVVEPDRAGLQRTATFSASGLAVASTGYTSDHIAPVLYEASQKHVGNGKFCDHQCEDPGGGNGHALGIYAQLGNSHALPGRGASINFSPIPLEALRGQMATLTKVMTIGLSEVNKIQDKLSCENGTIATCTGCLEDTSAQAERHTNASF